MKNILINSSLIFIFLINISIIAIAQKLPKVQNTSKRAPANITIDGNAADWGNQFMAFNTNNHIFYTVANDDETLYLSVRASDGFANEKALFGITFTIYMPGETGKKSKENISIMFPTVIEIKKREPIRNTVNKLRTLSNLNISEVKEKRDEALLVANKMIDNSFKEIEIKGISEIKNSVISINNTNGIKVAGRFDNNAYYVYELAIPLKYLGSKINNGQKFSYNIKMNGFPEKSPDSPFAPPMIRPDRETPSSYGLDFIQFSTDLKGEYTLITK